MRCPARRTACSAARSSNRATSVPRASCATKSSATSSPPVAANPTTRTVALGDHAVRHQGDRRARGTTPPSAARPDRVGHLAVVAVVPGRVPDPSDRGHVVEGRGSQHGVSHAGRPPRAQHPRTAGRSRDRGRRTPARARRAGAGALGGASLGVVAERRRRRATRSARRRSRRAPPRATPCARRTSRTTTPGRARSGSPQPPPPVVRIRITSPARTGSASASASTSRSCGSAGVDGHLERPPGLAALARPSRTGSTGPRST